MSFFGDGRNRVNAPTKSNRLTFQAPVATSSAPKESPDTIIEPSTNPRFPISDRQQSAGISPASIKLPEIQHTGGT